MRRQTALALVLAAPLAVACGSRDAHDPRVLRIGHFPNVTHAHGLVMHHRAGWLEQRLGPGIRVEWYVFNAGPSAMEALRAGSLDATYVGPNPALNTYVKRGGDEVRVVAGATRGGSALVVPGDGRIRAPADLRGKRLATPQVGNTQDVAARAWLAAAGLKAELGGGDVRVDGVSNPDQLMLFKTGELDAVWTVEPWVTRLELEAGGTLLVEEPEAITTILVVSVRTQSERPTLVQSLVAAHKELTGWLDANPKEALAEVKTALEAETKATFPQATLERAWGRLRFRDDVTQAEFDAFVKAAQGVGFLRDAVPLDRFVARP